MGSFSISTSLLIRAAWKKGLTCEFLPEKAIRISSPHASYYFKGTTLPCNNAVASLLAENKYFLRKLLQQHNIPTPKSIILRNQAAWESVLTSSLRFPLVVKPTHASHANGSSFNIHTKQELKTAIRKAFSYIKKHAHKGGVLVEEYVKGKDIRLLVVGDRVVSSIHREPAYVIGDGTSTIRQLIHAFNNTCKSHIKYDFPLCPIPMDTEISRCISHKNLSLSSVLPEGKKVHVRWNANVSTGGRAIDVTDHIHPHIQECAVRIARISQLHIAGIDLLCKDITSPDTSRTNITVLEANESPGLDIHHIPFRGQGKNVSRDILDYIFDISENERTKRLAQEILRL